MKTLSCFPMALGVAAIVFGCAHEQTTQTVANQPNKPAPAPEPVACTPQSNEVCPPAPLADCQTDVRGVLAQTLLHFDFDKDFLTPLSQKHLGGVAVALKGCPSATIVITGHCDERGTEEYNIALGQRRAEVAKKYLVALGVEPARVGTLSYGFERPADLRHNEQAWAMNRRDEFSVKAGASSAFSSRSETR